MTSAHIHTALKDGIAILTITPGDVYMTNRTVTELDAAMRAMDRDNRVRAVILTGGHPDHFIRHYDVKELERYADYLHEQRDIAGTVPARLMDGLLQRMTEMPKPVIAAINGTAMGGGFELCLACDIRIARAGDFALGQPEINIGILAGAGGTQRLARLIGPARALEMSLRGRTVDPAEALRLGMVHDVVADPVTEARQIAREIAAKSPAAVAAIKKLINEYAARPLEEGLIAERTLFRDLLVGEAAINLMRAMNKEDRDIRDMSQPET